MSAIKKGNSDSADQINQRVQRKFDLVFTAAQVKKKTADDTQSGSVSMYMDTTSDMGDMEMSSGASKKESAELPVIDLDFTIENELQSDIPAIPETKSSSNTGQIKLAEVPAADESGLDFDLDFNAVDDMVPEKNSTAAPAATFSEPTGGLDLGTMDGTDEIGGFDVETFNSEFAEDTQKTIILDSSTLSKVDLESFSLEDSSGAVISDQKSDPGFTLPTSDSSADLMSTEEAKANIELTIKDIVAPKNLDGTQEFDISKMADVDGTTADGFDLDSLDTTGDSFTTQISPRSSAFNSDSTGEFFVDPLAETAEATQVAAAPRMMAEAVARPEPVAAKDTHVHYEEVRTERMSDEDSVRFHATIRQMREEREELLAQIKQMKADYKELEQDNLTLKAGLDEAKIEISILRKRHMVELEDMKYRLTLSEEKKAMAIEQARQSEMRREKLEQKVRIDYNQVKLREKELESKLEMLSMDIDSQVHSRDQKILELRRKIDALEFNMENASMKEQRSNEDKRKLEDKLNKIMRTLRNSIKNLEEDIELVKEDVPSTEKN